MAGHQIQRLQARHQAILELALSGVSKKEIAASIGMTPQAISLITNAPLFQDALSRRREERTKRSDEERGLDLSQAMDTLEEGSIKAADKVVGLIDSPDERIALKSAESVLDRVFHLTDRDKTASVIVNTDQLQILQIAIQESLG